MLYFRIEKREECEMIMMIGLPGSGKTTWVEKHVAAHPEKRYNVIGASVLQERMKVNEILKVDTFSRNSLLIEFSFPKQIYFSYVLNFSFLTFPDFSYVVFFHYFSH